MKKTLALLLAVVLVVGFLPVTAKADNSVTVYLSLSYDDQYLTDRIETAPNVFHHDAMAFREITVPYFDLALYGLEDFYFNTETYYNGDPNNPYSHYSDLQPGTQQSAYGNITMLHLFIYAMERYYFGLAPADCGIGFLKDYMRLNDGYNPTKSFYPDNVDNNEEVIAITGTPGSIYFTNYWNSDDWSNAPDNLNYYKNYVYPLASPGWGATADQILIHTGDIITMGFFSGYYFYVDPDGVFSYAVPADTETITPKISASVGDTIDLMMKHARAVYGGPYTTSVYTYADGISLYYHSAALLSGTDPISGDLTDWTYIDDTDSDGIVAVDTTGWDPGTYIIAMPGQMGYYGDIACAPGGILLELSAAN